MKNAKRVSDFFTQLETGLISFIDKKLQENFANITKKSVGKFYTFVLGEDVDNLCGLTVNKKNEFFFLKYSNLRGKEKFFGKIDTFGACLAISIGVS